MEGLAGMSRTVLCTVKGNTHTSMVCETPIGTGFEQRWIVTVGEQPSALSSEATAYATPVISYIEEADNSVDMQVNFRIFACINFNIL